MQAKIDDLEKSMKRSNDKQLKIDHELCQRVGHVLQLCCFALLFHFYQSVRSHEQLEFLYWYIVLYSVDRSVI